MPPGRFLERDATDTEAYKTELEHLRLLNDAGMVEAALDGSGFAITRVTWAGHDFLDAIRSEGAMHSVREAAKKFGGLTLDVVKTIGTAWLKKEMHLP